MRRIDRKYAIIYIDDNGETLSSADLFTDDMISNYYQNDGFLQWNYYVIIPEELVPHDETIKIIETSDTYSRKFVMKRDEIDSFMEERFPEMNKENGVIELITGESWKQATHNLREMNSSTNTLVQLSIYRNESEMVGLTVMDELRAELIKFPKTNAKFVTHITNEISIAEKKFKLFFKK